MSWSEKFSAAERKFKALDQRLSEAAQYLQLAATALKDRRHKFSLSNSGVGLPMEAVMGSDCVSLNANQWPSADQIMALLSQWHGAKDELQAAWQQIPQEFRDRMTPPFSPPRGR